MTLNKKFVTENSLLY